MTLTLRQWLTIALVCVLLFAGWYLRGSLQTKADFRQVKARVLQGDQVATAVDQALTDKIKTEGAIDRGTSQALAKNQETARHAPSYRDYLDRPLPAESLRLYRDAAKAVAEAHGADRAEPEDDQGHH